MATSTARKAEWDESKHPRDRGRFSSSEGASGDDKPSMRDRMRPGGDLHGKATASLGDAAFVAQHANRLSHAGDEAKSNFSGREGSDEAHAAAMAHMHGEAMRIHAEEEAHGGDVKLKESADDARAISRANGGGLEAQHAAAMDAIASVKREAAEEQAKRDNEDRAIAAGHVSPEARQIADQYIAGHQERDRTINEHADALDKAHREAADALAALHEYNYEDRDSGDSAFDHHLHEGFNDTQRALHEAAGRDEAEDYANSHDATRRELPDHPDEALPEDIPGYVPHPDNSDRELSDHEYNQQLAAHEASHAQAQAEYDAAVAAHQAEFQRRASAAQDALERLHGQQVASHAALKEAHQAGEKAEKEASRKLDNLDSEKLVNEAAFAHHERDESGDFKEEHAAEAHAGAGEAAESMLEHANERVSEHGARDLGETLNSLKESTKSTAAALRDLGKITGRAPNIAKPPGKGKAKKSANRPDAAAGASVGPMAKAGHKYCPECGRQLRA